LQRQSEVPAKKLCVIGVDGATFDLILPWAQQGKLPHLQRLMDEGVRGTLQSTIPPISAPAWVSFMTGKNPGKHGVFDFIDPSPQSYRLRYMNGGMRRGKSLWRLLSEAGKTVTVINVPMTYPPEVVNGHLIAGLDAPDEQSPFTYPPSLYNELKHAVGDYRIGIRHLGFMRNDETRDQVLRELEQIERLRVRAMQHLMTKAPADFTMLVFNAVDQVQHHFWHYMDVRHPAHEAEGAAKYSEAILQMYRSIDAEIGEILSALPKHTATIVMSDHGAGPSGNRQLFLNVYLAQLGLLKFKQPSQANLHISGWFRTLMNKMDVLLRARLSHQHKAWLSKVLPGLHSRFASLTTASIDWSATQAFAYEAFAYSPNIWINLKDKMPQGIVSPGRDYQALVRLIQNELHDLRDPVSGQRLIRAAYRKDDVYQGSFSAQAPDLLLAWWEDGQFVMKGGVADTAHPAVVVNKGNFVGGRDLSGDHRMAGMMIMAGGPFKIQSELHGANIVDLTPTILYLMGLPIPDDMDGKVLENALRNDILATHRITRHQVTPDDRTSGTDHTYTNQEEEKIKERLRAMGYLE
jgi:predicted AlkP superfamily phosphohydrolase/phosphomutase